jgi:glutamate--cysteine ligase
MGFERYVDYALDVPMYFVKREDAYIDVSGKSFRDLLAGKLPGHGNLRATVSDWANHVSTIFPEVRLKRFLEMRGADGGRWRRICAVPAFWTGLLYDQTALDAAYDLIKGWTAEQRHALREAVPRTALRTRVGNTTVLEVARQALAIARSGLQRRAGVNAKGDDERVFLEPIEAILQQGCTPAEEMLSRFEREWGQRTDPLFVEYAF